MASYDDTIYNSIIDEVVNILTEIKDEIQANMQTKGINASGRTSAGFEVQRYESGVRLVLKREVLGQPTAPLGTLEVGRRGGKVPVGFAEIIEQWSRDKGLTFPKEGDRRSFAYLTARKIARQGTQRRQQPVDVYSTAVTNGVTKLRSAIKAQITEYIHNNLPQ